MTGAVNSTAPAAVCVDAPQTNKASVTLTRTTGVSPATKPKDGWPKDSGREADKRACGVFWGGGGPGRETRGAGLGAGAVLSRGERKLISHPLPTAQ